MTKFSPEVKLAAVKEYFQGNESVVSIGKRLGTDKKSIQKWLALYNAHGEEGLIARYTKYSAEFKLDVLKYMNETGASLIDTAAKFNIPTPSTVAQWKRIFEEQGTDALYPKKRGCPAMKKDSKKKQPAEGS